jgi:6-phosphogluconolactonase/glucosamine-6-phosphate isomerase/deaminase
MGIRDIMAARSILLVASGKSKSEASRRVTDGPVTEDVPASVLRLHPKVVFVVDGEVF